MNTRMFLDSYPELYSDQPKRTVADAIKEGDDDLRFMKTDAGWIAFNSKTGCIFRRKDLDRAIAQIPAFLLPKLVDYINAPAPPRIAVNLEIPLIEMTPEEKKEADESMRILQEEDR